MNRHYYTAEEVAFLTEHISGRHYFELTDLFNSRFGLHLSIGQVKAACKNRRLQTGITGHFLPGQVPHNKGKKGGGGWEPTQFKRGNRPHNFRPVGSERVNVDDYVEVKIADPKTWRHKHVVEWEKQNGPLPKGSAIIFADGDRRNFIPENLICISRKQLAYLNRNRLLVGDPEITCSALCLARVVQKVAALKRKAKRN